MVPFSPYKGEAIFCLNNPAFQPRIFNPRVYTVRTPVVLLQRTGPDPLRYMPSLIPRWSSDIYVACGIIGGPAIDMVSVFLYNPSLQAEHTIYRHVWGGRHTSKKK